MRKLLHYLSHYKLESVLAPLFKMLEASFELFVPLVMASIVDVGIKNADLPYILRMGGILIALGVIGLVCALTAQYFAAKAAAGFGTALRRDLFRHIGSLSYTELDAIGTSTLITRMTTDINQVQSCVNLALRLLLRSPFIVAGAMVMAFTVDVPAAFIFVVAIPLLSLVIFRIMAVTTPIYRKAQRQLDRILLSTRENLSGARVIRAFAREEEEIRDFDAHNQQLFDTQTLAGRITALMNPLTYVIINLAIVCLLWIGGQEVYTGRLTQGSVIALVNYMSQILIELIKLANMIVLMTRAFACADRVNQVLAQTTSLPDNASETPAPDPQAPVLEFRGAGFQYQGARSEVLSDLTFCVRAGETLGVIGGTGSGKTTLVSLIPRFYDLTSGQLLIHGRDVRDYPLAALRGQIGVVPQKAVLFKGTIRENMRWGKRDASDDEIWQALETAQAKDFVKDRPEGLDAPLLQGGQNLSGGQRQRLTIARALVRQPEILILDDSASALDYATDANLRRAIRRDIRRSTVILVSQRVATVRGADKILVLDDGHMAGCASHEELLKTCPVYQEICRSQHAAEEV